MCGEVRFRSSFREVLSRSARVWKTCCLWQVVYNGASNLTAPVAMQGQFWLYTFPMAERVVVLIDGGNLYRLLKERGIFPRKRFDYLRLVDFLLRGRNLVSKGYYVGIVRNHDDTEKSQKMVEGQQKFLGNIEAQGFLIERGRIVYDHDIREKGVDVKIAVDLVAGAFENKYDTAVVVSSDPDLIPTIKHVINMGKKVEYVGFSTRPSIGMTKECSLSVLLLQEDLEKLSS